MFRLWTELGPVVRDKLKIPESFPLLVIISASGLFPSLLLLLLLLLGLILLQDLGAWDFSFTYRVFRQVWTPETFVVCYNSSIRNFSSLLLDLGLEKSNLLLDLGRPYCWIRTRKVIIVISSLYNSFLLLGRETFLVLIVRLGAWKFLLLDLGLWDLSLSYRVFRHTILRLIYLFLWKFIM